MAENMLGNTKLGLKENRQRTNEKADMISYDFWSNSKKSQMLNEVYFSANDER